MLICSACSASSASEEPSQVEPDSGASTTTTDSGAPTDAEVVFHDAGTSITTSDAATDSGVDSGDSVSSWSLYTIAIAAHSATISNAASGAPIDGLVNGTTGRDYRFAFDPSAEYTLTAPVQPNDQMDWNKLPGISDCNQIDLSADGVMFGWRWRLDTTPKVLEITAYANDSSTHLEAAPLVTLDADDLASVTPLHYRLWIDGAHYQFSISGNMRGRSISETATLARECTTTATSTLELQWAAGFYFGGTSVSPSIITGHVFEVPFK